MKGRLRAVLFDWDGTLLDSAEATFRSYEKLFGSFGIAFDRVRFAETYSPDWYQTYAALELPRSHWPTADARWLELYAAETPSLISGAAEALARLRARGLAIGLVTSGSRQRVEKDLSRWNIAPLFDVLVCSEDAAHKKPHPAPLERALERLSHAPLEAACVGDSPEDIEMARVAGVYSVAIAGAFPNREALINARPDFLARDIEHAAEALLEQAARDRERRH